MLCTTLGFKPLGVIIPLDAPPLTHFLGALVAIVSGLLGGVTAAAVGGRAPVAHASAVLLATIAGGVVWKRRARVASTAP